MGVIIKYKLEFPEVRLTVSNDAFSGEFVIDADINALFERRAAGSSFEIKLYDLPIQKVKEIDKEMQDPQQPVRVLITLGYFDGPFEPVMEGAITSIASRVSETKLVTTIKGEEIGLYALKRSKASDIPPPKTSVEGAVIELLKGVRILKDRIVQKPDVQQIGGELLDKTLSGRTLMEVLNQLAWYEGAELLVADKKVHIGRPIRVDGHELELKEDVNLALFRPFVKAISEENDLNLLRPMPAAKAGGFEFTATGDPKLRSGNRVKVSVEGFNDEPASEYRLHSLAHRLTMAGGYVCEGVAVKAVSDKNCARREIAAAWPSAASITENLMRRNETERRNRPSIEVGKIKSYTRPQHRGTLYFGQPHERTETQPSIRTEVSTDENQLLRNKPLVSLFAWHKCGLVTPVYPGMKALLAHNLNLQDDALVVGFLWSEQPAFEPPQNQEGDWWLCLPIDFDTANPPADSTKAVNDLIANNGKRVIQVKGLKISVGTDSLPNVGVRPSEGADDEFLIEHKSGTKFRIAADGAVTIEASSVSIKGDVFIEGNVEVK
jgi:hypothetical protein